MKHLAIFIGDAIEKILHGEKSLEGRFSVDRVLPYGEVRKGDEIYLKESGGLVLGRVLVDNVLYYEGLDGEAIGKIRREYNSELCAGDDFWQTKSNSRYATLIFLVKPRRFLAPLRIYKRDRRAWVVLNSKSNWFN